MAQVTPELLQAMSQMIAEALKTSIGNVVQQANPNLVGEPAYPLPKVPPFSMSEFIRRRLLQEVQVGVAAKSSPGRAVRELCQSAHGDRTQQRTKVPGKPSRPCRDRFRRLMHHTRRPFRSREEQICRKHQVPSHCAEQR